MNVGRNRIWRSLLLSPWVALPFGIGVLSSAAFFLTGSGGMVAAASFTLSAIALATRMAFRFDQIFDRATLDLDNERKVAETNQLDNLKIQLRVDRDFRTKDILVAVRQLREEIQELMTSSEMKQPTHEIGQQVDHLFWTAIKQLEYALKLFNQADRMVDGQRKQVLEERESVVLELQSSVDRMRHVASHFRQLANARQDLDIKPLQEELDRSLQIAKRTEERMRQMEIGHSSDEFLKE